MAPKRVNIGQIVDEAVRSERESAVEEGTLPGTRPEGKESPRDSEESSQRKDSPQPRGLGDRDGNLSICPRSTVKKTRAYRFSQTWLSEKPYKEFSRSSPLAELS